MKLEKGVSPVSCMACYWTSAILGTNGEIVESATLGRHLDSVPGQIRSHLFQICTMSNSVGRPESDQFGPETRASNGDDDILPAVHHVGHRRSGLSRGHVYRTDFLAGCFVIRA